MNHLEFKGIGNVDDIPGIRLLEANITLKAEVRYALTKAARELMKLRPSLAGMLADSLEALATHIRQEFGTKKETPQ